LIFFDFSLEYYTGGFNNMEGKTKQKQALYNEYVDQINKDNFRHFKKYLSSVVLSWGLIKQYNEALKMYINFLAAHEEEMRRQGFLQLRPEFKEFYSAYISGLESLSRDLEVFKDSSLLNDLGEVLRLDVKKSLEDKRLCFKYVSSYIERLNNSSREIREETINEDRAKRVLEP
jgi:hypothetical protein